MAPFQRKDGKKPKKAAAVGRKHKQGRKSAARSLDFAEEEPENDTTAESSTVPQHVEAAVSVHAQAVLDAAAAEEELQDQEELDHWDPEEYFKMLDQEDAERQRAKNRPAYAREVAQRMTIAYFFEDIYGCPPRSEWKGQDGVIKKIRAAAKISKNTKIEYVLEDYLDCKKRGEEFTGQRRFGDNMGRPPFTDINSPEAQIVADTLEAGGGYKLAWNLVNFHRQQNEEDSLTYSCVRGLALRMKPKAVPVKARKQGSHDPNSVWARLRLNFVTQVLIRLGKLESQKIKGKDGKEYIPEYFDSEKLPKIHLHGICHWDETHPECKAGIEEEGAYVDVLPRFPRDENGKVDLENGSYDLTARDNLHVKYSKQVRVGIGAACVKPIRINAETGEVEELAEEGRRCKPYFYSGKKMVTNKEFQKAIDDEIARVKTMKRNDKNTFWLSPEILSFFANDPVTKVKGIKEAKQRELKKYNIETVKHLDDLKEEMKIVIDRDPNCKLSKHELTKFQNEVKDKGVEPGDRPPRVSPI